MHYTFLAIQEGYNVDFSDPSMITYTNPAGQVVATSTEVWEAVVIPQVLANYTERKRDQIASQFEYSFILGFDYYHYTKSFWIHSWGNVMPYHIEQVLLIITINSAVVMGRLFGWIDIWL